MRATAARSLLASLLLLATVMLAAAPAAHAGGDFVDLAAAGPRHWFVGPFGVRSVDTRTGRTVATPSLAGPAYPLSVAVAGGAAWVASVENGYVWGTLSRIDERSLRVRVVWRRRDSSVQNVAAGADSVWALIGSRTGARVARFSLAGRLLRLWRIPDAGRLSADGRGCWISTNRWLLRIDAAGTVHRVVRAALGDVATGADAAWLPRSTSVLRIDARSGRIRTLVTGPLRLGGFQHDVAADAGSLWILEPGRGGSTLVRFDVRTGRRTGTTMVRGIADAVVVTPHAVWVAAVVAPPGRRATGYALVRVDPRTMRRTRLVEVA